MSPDAWITLTTIVAIFAGLVLLFFFLPATEGRDGDIYLVAVFKGTEHHGVMYLVAIMEVGRLILVGLCYMFMSAPFLLRKAHLPQIFAFVLLGLPLIEILTGGIGNASKTSQGGLFLTAVWTSLFYFFAYTSTAIGMAGLLTRLRRRR